MGGGETPPFVGGSQQALFVASMLLLFCLSGSHSSWVCWFACIFASSLYGLLYHLPAGFLPGKGCWKLWGPLNCLVFRQAVCDTYVN